MSALTFRDFQLLNRLRCREAFHTAWPIPLWCLAIAGEAGELCNLVKKSERGDFALEERRQEVLDEIADIITYCDLLISELGAETDQVLLSKFERVSARYGWPPKERPHMETAGCWCGPRLEYEDPDTGNKVWVHNRGQ